MRTRADAVSLLLSRLPLTFPVVAPVRLLTSRHHRHAARDGGRVRTRTRVASAAALWIGYVRGAPRSVSLAPEDCPDAPRADLEASAVAAAAWIERGQGDDGRYVYEYDRDTDLIAPGYNIVRHAGVTMSLYQLARAGHPEVLDTADAGLAVMLDSLVPAGDGMAFVENDRSARLGASALMAAALAQRRDATGDDTLRRRVAGLGSVPRRPDHDRRADAQHVRSPGRGAGPR